MNFQQILDVSTKLSLAGVLILILVGGYQGLWVYGPTFKAMVADRDEWKQLALQGANLVRPRVVAYSAGPPAAPLPPTATKSDVRAKLQEAVK